MVTVAFHSPAIFFSISCWGPGVAALLIFSIITCCSAAILGGASAANATVVMVSATAASTNSLFIGNLLEGGGVRPGRRLARAQGADKRRRLELKSLPVRRDPLGDRRVHVSPERRGSSRGDDRR